MPSLVLSEPPPDHDPAMALKGEMGAACVPPARPSVTASTAAFAIRELDILEPPYVFVDRKTNAGSTGSNGSDNNAVARCASPVRAATSSQAKKYGDRCCVAAHEAVV